MNDATPNPGRSPTPRPPRPPRPEQDGFAVKADGTLVFKNWYFVTATSVITGIFVLLTPVVFFFIIPALVAAWALFLEWTGVEMRDGKISYPVRLGIPLTLITEVLPLARNTVDLSKVTSASTSTIHNTESMFINERLRVAHLTGEFGATKIVFDSKAGRDRLFAVLKEKYPHISIHRWT